MQKRKFSVVHIYGIFEIEEAKSGKSNGFCKKVQGVCRNSIVFQRKCFRTMCCYCQKDLASKEPVRCVGEKVNQLNYHPRGFDLSSESSDRWIELESLVLDSFYGG